MDLIMRMHRSMSAYGEPQSQLLQGCATPPHHTQRVQTVSNPRVPLNLADLEK